MKSNEIRQRFLTFFADRGHRIVRSASLVPANDPTLLFTNAGMNQFKDVFLGREKRDYSRACSSQKCVRAGGKHNDLEQVGRTRRHHTFFEMLGNFSFGDYFKAEAIPWAWELVTKDFGIPKDKLYATVFEGSMEPHADIPRDSEAYDLWRSVGVPEDRIFELGMHDNFWQMGDTGPCGPCSELHYDMGPAASDLGHTDCKFPCDCGRFTEIWNLVFMQFNRDEHGQMTPLPRPCVDTGAGLERLAAVLQGKISNFDTDLFKPLIDEAAALANVEYGAKHDTDVSLRIIADHARASTFLISDGVLPSNEGRGYVLRRILRRALYHGQTLGLKDPFLYKISSHVVDMMNDAYPELAETAHHVAKAIKSEEERFERTLALGSKNLYSSIFDGLRADANFFFRAGASRSLSPQEVALMLSDPEAKRKLEAMVSEEDQARVWARVADLERIARGKGIKTSVSFNKLGRYYTTMEEDDRPPSQALVALAKLVRDAYGVSWKLGGNAAFKLYDTYGLPLDLIVDACRDLGLEVDLHGFEAAMERQRERARASWKGAEKKVVLPVYEELVERQKTVFKGYEYTVLHRCKIVALLVNGRTEDMIAPAPSRREVEIVLDKTPFYAEAGGQVGDVGRLIDPDNQRELALITDTYSPISGLIVHRALVTNALLKGQRVTAAVDAERRDAIRRNHTATHLLHAALRTTLGTHVKQRGSLVAPDRMRFDFSHFAELGEQDLLDIEDLVNQHILKNEAVRTDVMDIDQALQTGAMALFGEKYGDRVRVLSVEDGDFSRELCGGTHVSRTGDIGLFKIVSEGSVAAGTRRIEAITGMGVLTHVRKADETLAMLGEVLRAKPEEVLDAAEKLAETEKKLRKQLDAQQMKRAAAQAGDLLEQAQDVKGVRVVSARVEGVSRPAMRQMVDQLRAKLGSGVIALGAVSDSKAALIIGVTKDLTTKLDAGKIVRQAAALMEGSGGGRKDLAEAGGKNPDKLDASLQAVPQIIEKML